MPEYDKIAGVILGAKDASCLLNESGRPQMNASHQPAICMGNLYEDTKLTN